MGQAFNNSKMKKNPFAPKHALMPFNLNILIYRAFSLSRPFINFRQKKKWGEGGKNIVPPLSKWWHMPSSLDCFAATLALVFFKEVELKWPIPSFAVVFNFRICLKISLYYKLIVWYYYITMATMKGKAIAFVTAIATTLEERTVLSLFLIIETS